MSVHVTPSELLIGMLVVVAAIALLAEKLKIAYPILLVLAGTLVGVPPFIWENIFPKIRVDPDTVFLLFLPPLLYYGGLLTTFRDFKANMGQISGLAVGLVLATIVAVAVTAMWTIPGMTWATAFLLGAIVSPPDAVSTTAVLGKTPVPKRVITLLEGESLVNDATALVAYRVAIGAVLAGTFSIWEAGLWVFVAAVGGLAVGLLAAWVVTWLMRRIDAPAVEATLALLVPYAAFLPADKLGASGVLAAVAAGVYMGRKLPEIGSPKQRLRTLAVWDSLVFLLNGMIFILIGVQLFDVVTAGIIAMSLQELILGSLAVCAACILIRVAWVFPAIHLPQWFSPKTATKVGWKETTIVSWAGMRGIVTLAAALAVPHYSDAATKTPFPNREVMIFVAFAVILVTLVFQGITLGPLIKLMGVKPDTGQEEGKEETQARLDAAHAAVSRLTVLSFDESINPEVINRVRAEYDERIAKLGGSPTDELGTGLLGQEEALKTVRLEALRAERKMITFMRDQNILGDEILRRILEEIDLEEAKLQG